MHRFYSAYVTISLLATPEAPAGWEAKLAWFGQQAWCTDEVRSALAAVRQQMAELGPSVPEYARDLVRSRLELRCDEARLLARTYYSDRYRAWLAAHSMVSEAYELLRLRGNDRWPTQAEREEVERRYRELPRQFREAAEEFREKVHPKALDVLLKKADEVIDYLRGDSSWPIFAYRLSDADQAELRGMFVRACRGLADYFGEVGLKGWNNTDWMFAAGVGSDLWFGIHTYVYKAAGSGVEPVKPPPVPPTLRKLREENDGRREALTAVENEARLAAWEVTDRATREANSPEAIARLHAKQAEEYLRTHGPPPPPIHRRLKPEERRQRVAAPRRSFTLLYLNLAALGVFLAVHSIVRFRAALKSRRDGQPGPPGS